MKSIAEQIVGDSGERAPQPCIDALYRVFKNPINIEWLNRGDVYEAIFYSDSFEVIVLISPNGEIIETKRFIEPDQISSIIKVAIKEHGEIMNVVQIEKNNQIYFEIIVRDSSLIRSVIYVNNDGSIIEKVKL
jgi:hypothetical protein